MAALIPHANTFGKIFQKKLAFKIYSFFNRKNALSSPATLTRSISRWMVFASGSRNWSCWISASPIMRPMIPNRLITVFEIFDKYSAAPWKRRLRVALFQVILSTIRLLAIQGQVYESICLCQVCKIIGLTFTKFAKLCILFLLEKFKEILGQLKI